MRTIPGLVGCVCALLTVAAEHPHSSQETTAATPYLVLDARRTPTLERELTAAASAGYRVVGALNALNSERVLILRKSPDAERYTYHLASIAEGWRGTSTPDLPADLVVFEKKLNDAAVDGFRLLPNGVIRLPSKRPTPSWKDERLSPPEPSTSLRGDALIAVMEKASQTAAISVIYRVLCFVMVHEVRQVLLKSSIVGRLDRERVDQRLAEAARDGYRVVTVMARDAGEGSKEEIARARKELSQDEGIARGFLTRAGSRDVRSFEQELVVVLEKTSRAPQAVGEAAGLYHVVTAVETDSGLEQMLNQSAAAGYRLLGMARHGHPEFVGVFERNAPAAARSTYAVLASRDLSMLSTELARAATSGWLLHPGGVIDTINLTSGGFGETLLVLEKKGSPTVNLEFQVVNEVKSSNLAKRLGQAAAAGFELVNASEAQGELILVMTRSKPASQRQP